MNPVVWLETALDLLADIWVQATPEERDRIAAAIDRANAELADDPSGSGESRSGNDRVLCRLPIAVRFRVDPGPTVIVYHVHHVRARR